MRRRHPISSQSWGETSTQASPRAHVEAVAFAARGRIPSSARENGDWVPLSDPVVLITVKRVDQLGSMKGECARYGESTRYSSNCEVNLR